MLIIVFCSTLERQYVARGLVLQDHAREQEAFREQVDTGDVQEPTDYLVSSIFFPTSAKSQAKLAERLTISNPRPPSHLGVWT